MTISSQEYIIFDKAYDFFNKNLFDSQLPECVITLQRKPKMKGYYWSKQFSNRKDKDDTVAEIALNPDSFQERSGEEILSTLTHEMVHCYQDYLGHAPKKAYHDKEFAILMETVGLWTTSNGQLDGKRTGSKCTHLIMEDGLFKKYCNDFLKENNLNWQSNPIIRNPKEKKKSTRAKHVCPSCENQAMAKPSMKLICGYCQEEMVIEEK